MINSNQNIIYSDFESGLEQNIGWREKVEERKIYTKGNYRKCWEALSQIEWSEQFDDMAIERQWSI